VPNGVVTRGTIVIRADADETIGIGHVGRTLALAEAWRRGGGRVRYVAAAPMAARATDWIRSAGHDLGLLDVARYSEQDAHRTAAIAGGATIVVDAFGSPLAYRSELRARARRLAIIDDVGGPGPWCADLIVNQNHGATADRYPGHDTASLLLGPRYALLRPEFARWRALPRRRDGEASRIAVSFGGADPEDTASETLAALLALPGARWRAIIAAGTANPRAEMLKEKARRSGGPIQVVRRPSSMARLFAWADVAVLAGGSTVWEAFCVGTPVIGIAIADNQVPASEALGRDGLWRYLGRAGQVTQHVIADALGALLADSEERQRLSRAGRAMVDGEGSLRIAEAIARL